ncbi:response regulator [Paenibacillus sp. V4I5]|uniref:response regulator n=1 Tax=Paenibacillus sp. V4I5 TaxID=3042306 RepID=UPI002792F421|nr:response regulator [Paenibacillus sp. V4I5]MDQ0915929.1 CheY-like chemotaxis protein/HAMP domain-containing protein [Paenibacillus sp. V4I5]
MQWIRNAKINYKLIFMIVLPMLGLLYFSSNAIYEKVKELSELNRLQTLVTTEIYINDLIHEIQKERSLLSGYFEDKTVTRQLVDQRKFTEDKISAFREQLRSLNTTVLGDKFKQNANNAVSKLDQMVILRTQLDQGKANENETLSFYMETINSLFDMMQNTNEISSNKQISNMVNSYILFSKSKFAVSRERSLLFHVFSLNRADLNDFEQIGVLENEQLLYYKESKLLASEAAQQLYQETVKGQAINEVDRLIRLVLQTEPGKALGVDSQQWYNVATQEVDLLKEVEDGLSTELIQSMEIIKKSTTQSLIGVAIFNVIILILSFLVIVLISRMLLSQIRLLKRSTELILTGVTDIHLDVQSKDEFGELMEAFNQMVASFKEVITQADRISLGEYEQTIVPRSDRDQLSVALIRMLTSLKETTAENERQFWLKTQLARLTGLAQGVTSVQQLVGMLISEISRLVGAGQGIIYLKEMQSSENQSNEYVMLGSYAFKERKNVANRVRPGEGLVGQCILEKKPILLSNVPGDYIHIQSGLGESKPFQIVVLPILFEEDVLAVIELASFKPFTGIEHELLEQLSDTLGVVIQAANSRQKTEALLRESQLLTEELQTQQEELRTANEELEEQTLMLKQSEEKMRIQSEELQAINEELEEKTNYLEVQKADIEKQNAFIQLSKQDLEEKAKELELASQYKSEFLANMSHELRTPLNSLLILSKSFSSNEDGNLNEDQIESAKIIHSGGLDLLTLINDILDLSKVEAGKLDIQMEEVRLDDLLQSIRYQFNPAAKQKVLSFILKMDDQIPEIVTTDGQRTEQILKNLLSNAFKFTASGSVTVEIARAGKGKAYQNKYLEENGALALTVTDTGIGIPANKQQAIFEAFQQADGTTSRKYGGTGLGLTISRELAKLLGGEIHMRSTEGKGSSFTLYLPLGRAANTEISEPKSTSIKAEVAESVDSLQFLSESLIASTIEDHLQVAQAAKTFLPDDRLHLRNTVQDKIILIVEDDPTFAKILMDMSYKKGFKCLAAGDGFSALQLAKQHIPSAILLDLGLPDMDGLKVLDHLKYHNETRHIPVHIISGREKSSDSLQRGAIGYLSKPIQAEDIEAVFNKIEHKLQERIQQVLVVEDDLNNQKAIHELLKHKKVDIHSVSTGKDGLQLMRSQPFDCVILDLTLPDMTGFELLQQLVVDSEGSIPPIIINTGKELTQEEYKELNHFTDSIVIKGANSPDRLLDEVSLFLHSVHKSLPQAHKEMIRMVRDSDESLKGRKILLVDDDLRNTFALSKVLRKHGLDVVMADNGKLALDKLESESGIELVIMDIMMPVMDGYEAIGHIRTMPKFQSLPIIALTAKAMTGDREKCIERGANDYMTKPVDTDKLLSLIRVWLLR